ncbi:unnamed protein product [Pelagomonas calceolata]|uniref:Uncharacterized protein n=1 Tax=Pelagomonas calceolata TaxID=35677 RepID=A0A8J2S7X6_9STRA|nr:unnamed protein product [Pelagomonas calceolata]|mmetsp:Transcript_18895/g.53877  ORF Transcript_18895/g.53877 Transcript_18895/m.53877 type:complete len:267 (-) Transcript_18895:68-868(-)
MAAALQLTTTVGEHKSAYDDRYTGYTGALVIQAPSYQQAKRDLLDQGEQFLEDTWSTLVTVPDAARQFLDKQQLGVIGDGFLNHCERSIRGLCKLNLADQIQELQGPTGRYPGPTWLSSSRQLSTDGITLLVSYVTPVSYAAYLEKNFEGESKKRKYQGETVIDQTIQAADIKCVTWLHDHVGTAGFTMDQFKDFRKEFKDLKLDHEKYKAVKSGPEFYKMMSGESDPVKKAWMQYHIDKGLIDTRQIPQEVIVYYKGLGVKFPGL